jgi:hypothetical protein
MGRPPYEWGKQKTRSDGWATRRWRGFWLGGSACPAGALGASPRCRPLRGLRLVVWELTPGLTSGATICRPLRDLRDGRVLIRSRRRSRGGAGEQQVPRLRRRWRSGSARNDKVVKGNDKVVRGRLALRRGWKPRPFKAISQRVPRRFAPRNDKGYCGFRND